MAGFFSKMKQDITKNVNALSVKSSSMIETNKLKNEISSIKKQKTDIFQSIGEKVYSMKLEEQIDLSQLEEQFEKLAGLDSQIAEKEKAIEEVAKKKEEELNALNSQTAQEASDIKCQCGASITKDTKFCPKCGAKIEQESETVAENADYSQQETQVQETAEQETVVQEVETEQAKEEEVSQADTTVLCECGAELTGSEFCANCGKKVQ